MVNKKFVKRNIKQLQRVKTWQLVVLLVLMSFISATFLRLNNIGMVERRTAVINADVAGDDGVTQSRLYDLQRYVSAHMGTDMGGGFYLLEARKRDAQAIYDKAAEDTNPNGNIYKKAQEVCAPKFTHYSYAYLQCTTDELAKYPEGSDLISVVSLPPARAYLHVYLSPFWSPDFAGWSLVVCVVILIMILLRLIGVVILRILLRQHYKSI